ncbi:MAG: hypothetical protein FWD34_05940 [Oscillospiraceae bacterium]|nr:hypothetical protein [Oscillospiraceae bacterium]
MTDNKILMFKLRTGNFVKSGYGKGREQFNINENAIINGKYYGAILNTGRLDDISLEQIDNSANKNTMMIDGVTIVYFEEIQHSTCIVAIAENTIVYRRVQEDEDIVKHRVHLFESSNDHHLHGESETVGYHTVTNVDDMHLLKENFIPISIPKECTYFFRAQRALSKETKYESLRKQIIERVSNFLNDTEIDLQPEQIENAEIETGKNSSNEPLSICNSSNGRRISKKPSVSKNALFMAKYLCEYDPTHQTFSTNKGDYFMEGHHLIRCTVKISEEFWDKYKKNIDTESNIVSLCPNCHRMIHFGTVEKKIKMLERLYEIKKDKLHKDGIILLLNDLKHIYGI